MSARKVGARRTPRKCFFRTSKQHPTETVEQAYSRTLSDLERLTKLEPADGQLGDALCAHILDPDVEVGPISAIEAHEFRTWTYYAMNHVYRREHAPACVITLLIDRVPLDELRHVSLASIKARLRTILDRCGFHGSIIIGGIEADYKVSSDTWVLHAHLLLIRPDELAIKALRGHLRKHFGLLAVKIDQLRDPSRQISYCVKRATYHRPAPQSGSRKSRAYPLPRLAYLELMRWWAQCSCTDLLFLYGVRRQGRKLVPTKQTMSTMSTKSKSAPGLYGHR